MKGELDMKWQKLWIYPLCLSMLLTACASSTPPTAAGSFSVFCDPGSEDEAADAPDGAGAAGSDASPLFTACCGSLDETGAGAQAVSSIDRQSG